jgi:hypothetical protein
MDDAERKARAEHRRRSAVLVRTTLHDEQDPHPLCGAEAMNLVWTLTIESWRLAGKEIPPYDRASTPYRFVRGRLT